MKIFSTTNFILAIGLAGAFILPGEANAKAVTTAVFQDEGGTPCRIRLDRGVRTVQCHIRGKWVHRQACAGDELIAQQQREHRPFIRFIPKPKPRIAAPTRSAAVNSAAPATAKPQKLPAVTKTPTAVSVDEATAAAQAAWQTALDVRRALNRPTVAVAFANF